MAVPSTDIVGTFFKKYLISYRRYFFGKVFVPLSSVLQKYRVPTSGAEFVEHLLIALKRFSSP